MYSQIFVSARHYHSSGSPERRFTNDDVSVHACAIARGCLFLPPLEGRGGEEGWNSFRDPTPSSPVRSAVRLLRLSLSYCSKLDAQLPSSYELTSINHSLTRQSSFFSSIPRFSILRSPFGTSTTDFIGRDFALAVFQRSRLLLTTLKMDEFVSCKISSSRFQIIQMQRNALVILWMANEWFSRTLRN